MAGGAGGAVWAGALTAACAAQGEIVALKLALLISCPPVRALFLTRSPLADVPAGMGTVWFVNVCVVATLVDHWMAVVGFAGLKAGGLPLDASCGQGDKYVYGAVPFLRQASGTDRAKSVLRWVLAVFVLLCIALGET